MDYLSIILIAVGLAMDCFAVSVSKGLEQGSWHHRALWMALLFGVFQGAMPLIGYFAGTLFASFFSRFAPWIALLLLGYIGGKMLIESLVHHDKDSDKNIHKDHNDTTDNKDRNMDSQPSAVRCDKAVDWSLKTLILLAIATSIDALATGVIFIPVPQVLAVGISVIAAVSLLFSLTGYIIGWRLGCRFKLNVEAIGGVILILIGLKIFIEGIFL